MGYLGGKPEHSVPIDITAFHTLTCIQVMKDLDHPNVVKLYEVISSQADRKVLMIMEYVEVRLMLATCTPVSGMK